MRKLFGLIKNVLRVGRRPEDELPLLGNVSRRVETGEPKSWKLVLLRFKIRLRMFFRLDGSRKYHDLARQHWERFERSDEREELERSIDYDRITLELRPVGHPRRFQSLNNLATSLAARYKRWGQMDDLEETIELWRAALELLHKDHSDRSKLLSSLASSLHSRFEQRGVPEDLGEVVALDRAILGLRPKGHPDRSQSLNNLAASLSTQFEQFGRMEDLEETIKLHRAALELRPKGHPDRSQSLHNLADSLHKQFWQHGRTEDLDTAVELHQAALELQPEDHGQRSMFVSNLACSLHTRYSQHGRTEDLDRAIKLNRTALELRAKGHPDRSISLGNLAYSLNTRFEQYGRAEDLEEAIQLQRAALELRPEGHPDRPLSLGNLSDSLRTRFEQYGGIEDVEEAIKLDRAALKLRSEAHPLRSVSLGNLADSLRTRFEQLGKTEDLEEAIELNRAALELRSEEHPGRSITLGSLAYSLSIRFEQHGRNDDLEEAIKLERAILELCPNGHSRRSICLGNLADSLRTRFEQYRRMEDLQEAITLDRITLELRPDDHPLRSMSLNNLVISLLTRFEQLGGNGDLEEAVELNRAALVLRPEGHPFRSKSLSNLALSLHTRFSQHGRTEELDETVELNRAALELRPEGHPLRSMSLRNLANSLYTRIEQRWCMEEFEECMQLLELAATHRFSGLLERLSAARRWADLARLHDHNTAFTAYKATISLLQHALTINPTLYAQHDFLSQSNEYRMLTLEAASFAVEKNESEQAIEILEQGRALLWSQLRGLRTPLDQLAEKNEGLAHRFMNVSHRLENLATTHEASMSGPTMDGGGPLRLGVGSGRKLFDELLKLKRQLSSEQEEIISEIRRMEGFESFLEATPFKILQRAASEGPVIVVNHCQYRSDALVILFGHDESAICNSLYNEFFEDSIKLCIELMETRRQLSADSPEYDKKLREAMKMLWDRVVSKVVAKLNELGIVEGSHIWWCPTSMLSVLPFHAAGPFVDADAAPKYLLDNYISSYTPTLGALVNARSGSHKDETAVLVIGDTSLRSARQEVRNIRNSGTITKLLVGKKASRESVIKQLQKATWVHFVCHGQLNPKPFDTSFKLSDGGLTLLDVVQTSLPSAEFAFLSACHTAEQPHHGTHDEVLHLAAAMQFSGFRSVIGSMWELFDQDGPAFAKTVYEYMNECEEGEAKYKRAAGGLRRASLELKSRTGIPIERWVNLVHIGA